MALTVATIPSPTNGSLVLQQNFINQAPQIGGKVWRYTHNKSKWARMIKRGTLPNGQGDTMRTLFTERAMLGSNNRATWQRHMAHGVSSLPTGTTPPDVGVGRGLPPVTVVTQNSRLREFYPYWAAIQSVRIDVNDARLGYRYTEQVANLVEGLFEVADRAWGYQIRSAFFNMCKRKVIVGATSVTTNPLADLSVVSPEDFSGLLQYTLAQLNATSTGPASGTTWSDAHSTLTGGVLRGIYARQNLIGAGDRPPGRTTGGAPAYPLMCSLEQADYLMREPGTRSDHRWEDASVLLKGMGVFETVGGFSYIIDPEVPRFTLALVGSLYDFTEVHPWVEQAGFLTVNIASAAAGGTGRTILTVDTTVGLVTGNVVRIAPTTSDDSNYSGEFRVAAVPSATTVTIETTYDDTFAGVLTLLGNNGQSQAVENPDYPNAPYEMSFIVHPEVMEILVPEPISTLGSGTKFNPAKTIGDFQWCNIQHEIHNPRGTIGFFDGVLEQAAKPIKTDYGWSIMHRRATPEYLARPNLTLASGLGLTQ